MSLYFGPFLLLQVADKSSPGDGFIRLKFHDLDLPPGSKLQVSEWRGGAGGGRTATDRQTTGRTTSQSDK